MIVWVNSAHKFMCGIFNGGKEVHRVAFLESEGNGNTNVESVGFKGKDIYLVEHNWGKPHRLYFF